MAASLLTGGSSIDPTLRGGLVQGARGGIVVNDSSVTLQHSEGGNSTDLVHGLQHLSLVVVIGDSLPGHLLLGLG